MTTVDTYREPFRKHALLLLLCLMAFLPALALGATQAKAADSAVILIYHRFGDDRYPSTNTRVDQLEAQIKELTSGPYHVLPVKDIVAAFKAGTSLPDHTVGITVDDAYESVYKVAFPRFKAAGLPFTLFVATEPVDAKDGDFMTWDQIREMMGSGVDVGNHTVSHLHMIGRGEKENLAEIEGAQKRLTDELGVAPVLFAYPYGEFGMAEASLVERQGFLGAFAQFSGVAHAGSQLYMLPRFALNEKYGGIDRFKLIVNALPIPAREFVPADPVLGQAGEGNNPPAFGFTLMRDLGSLKTLACYPSNMDKPAKIEILGKMRVEVRFDKPFPQGRSRINCTMQGPNGRWRWLGRPFFVQ